jgi:L-2-amino-thiazoline-4-carboxylic acid hydrolase-like protein
VASAFHRFADGGALDYEVLSKTPDGFDTADFPMAEGLGPDVQLTCTQTIMQGASHCDFRYVLRKRRDGPERA